MVEGDLMKHNFVYEDVKFEQVSLLDEACKIYPNLSEVRKKSPNTYKDFEKMYEEMCRRLVPECRSLTHACSIVNLIFRVHESGINYSDKTRGNVFFLKLSEKTVDRLLNEVEQFKLWVDCILRTQP